MFYRLLQLRATWDSKKFIAVGDGPLQEGKGTLFDPTLMTETMQYNLFFAYIPMALRMHDLFQSISGFAEGCYCHEFMLKGRNLHMRTEDLIRGV